MTGSRRGSLIAATWLIGLGVLFLVRQAFDLSWTVAWPMFVILVGVGSLVSTAVNPRAGPGPWPFTWSAVWVVVGFVLLASTTGSLGASPGELIAEYWPWLLVALGIWFLVGAVFPSRGPTERLTIPLDGAAMATVRIRFGAGSLSIRPASAGNLVDGDFKGGVRSDRTGPGGVELAQDTSFGLPFVDRESRWDVGVAADVPLDLRLDAGASRTRIDLRDSRLRTLELHTGASETHVVLPRAAGATSVRAEAGAASLIFEVPAGVAARIRSRMTLGSTQIDRSRFPQVGDEFMSPDYATATNRVDLDIQGGVGSLRIIAGT